MSKQKQQHPEKTPPEGVPRRDVLRAGGVFVASFGLFGCQGGRVNVGMVTEPGQGPAPVQPAPGQSLFLDAQELITLEALTDVFIPGDLDAGAVEARCAQAINILLSAFAFDPPMIFAGGPFSNRGGSSENDFEQFVPLDRYEEMAWRLKIEGSQGQPEREFNGPVAGWQQTYREGLAALDSAASGYGFSGFAQMPLATRELLLRAGGDDAVTALVDVAFIHTLDAMYGAPEYGGNFNLAGWDFTGYMGDVQPRGFSAEEVENPDNPGLQDLLPVKRFQARSQALPQAALLPLPSVSQLQQIQQVISQLMLLHSEELSLGLMLDAQGSWQRLRSRVQQLSGSAEGQA